MNINLDKLKAFFLDMDWFIPSMAFVILLFLVVVFYFFYKGTITISIWKFKITPNKAIQKIQSQFEDLNEHSAQQLNVMKLLNQTYYSYSLWGKLENDDFLKKMNDFYNMFLPGIISLITKDKKNMHRIAVFCENDQDQLVILHGHGFSVGGIENLKLGLYNTMAGNCFINNKSCHNNDLTKDPNFERNPKSSRIYHSLLCVPVVYNEKVIGVLNIDGLTIDSFTKDDIDYISYFANALSPILYKELLFLSKKEEGFIHEQKSG